VIVMKTEELVSAIREIKRLLGDDSIDSSQRVLWRKALSELRKLEHTGNPKEQKRRVLRVIRLVAEAIRGNSTKTR
jgi:hypothetical protein